ncbi:MAG: ABC transporter ATP-binding protein [Hyphomicrobiales bacterium]
MNNTPDLILNISNATGGYEQSDVIKGISLTVKRTEIVALLGRNGAGKSTLMRYIMAQLPLASGQVEIMGQKAPQNTAQRVHVGLGYVPQGRFIFPRLTVKENIAVAAATHKHNATQAFEQAVDDFPILAPKANNLGGSLSGGQQQILALARALATKPQVLLLDEPTEGVQPSIIDEMIEILQRINTQRGIAMLIAEQNLDFCLALASRAYILGNGKLKAELSSADLKADEQLQKQHLGI